MRNVYDFVGLPPFDILQGDATPKNTREYVPMGEGTRARLKEFYAPHNARLYQEKELVPEPVTITVGHEVGVFLRGTQAKGFMGLRVTNCGVFVAAKCNEKAANCVFLQFALLNSPLPCDTTAPVDQVVVDCARVLTRPSAGPRSAREPAPARRL